MDGFMLNLIVVFLFTLLLTAVAYAGSIEDPGVQKRIGIEGAILDQGIESGQLTQLEAGQLEAEQAKIKQDEAGMKSDGNLTKKERAKLHRELDQSRKHIQKQKHNRQQVNTG